MVWRRNLISPLGVLPLGTTNDFARAMGIPKNWEDSVDLILRQESRPIDIGKANDRYFINIAGGGSLTELTYEVPSKLKTMIGQLAYYLKGIEKMVSLSPQELIIRANGQEVIHDEFMLFLIANTNSVGGFEKLAPGARIDDGLLDVIAVKNATWQSLSVWLDWPFVASICRIKRLCISVRMQWM